MKHLRSGTKEEVSSKRNLLFLLFGMLMSISFLQANVQSANTHNYQQMTWYAATQAVDSGGGTQAQVAWGITGAIGYDTTSALLTAGIANGWNPAGWICLGAAAVTGA